ncbi:hypothetical protein RFI_36383 [Reticulomyxa filosa]|uniref:Uncharacterized protein n=1 Tax=Reticulomyxa filosa TaxID=46433 RepID=X6LGE2_RETFI|nr:hypothetical protein RFI_36383 [Reticulomyxa filosa]|eukprot:ETO01058.1 hypothetical protein RFI_36383 [Reticulomyxa filosa]
MNIDKAIAEINIDELYIADIDKAIAEYNIDKLYIADINKAIARYNINKYTLQQLILIKQLQKLILQIK